MRVALVGPVVVRELNACLDLTLVFLLSLDLSLSGNHWCMLLRQHHEHSIVVECVSMYLTYVAYMMARQPPSDGVARCCQASASVYEELVPAVGTLVAWRPCYSSTVYYCAYVRAAAATRRGSHRSL